jgi:molecular chaperone Hsp33
MPFAIEGQDLRGRLARLGPVVDDILNRHDYPEPVARILGEALTLVALVGSALKFDGIFTLQTKSDGTIKTMVADYRAPGALRGYVAFDAARLSLFGKAPSFRALMGRGYLALTIDQGPGMEPYQGIVNLDGDNLAECADGYFRDSEQIPTKLQLSVARESHRGPNGLVTQWRSGGIMLQFLPPSSQPEDRAAGGDWDFRPVPEDGTAAADAWARAQALMATVQDDELTDPTLSSERLLFRLFHEDGVRVFGAEAIRFQCRCGPERVRTMLSGFGADEINDMAVDGVIEITCEFCSTRYSFKPEAFLAESHGTGYQETGSQETGSQETGSQETGSQPADVDQV